MTAALALCLVGGDGRQLARDLVHASEADAIDVIPTGSLGLDQALGIGGYPRGRIVEIFGPDSSGKSTLVLHALREAQRDGGIAALIDVDRSFHRRYAPAIGLDPDRLLLARPEHAEQALDAVEDLVLSGKVTLVAIDSAAALAPKVEIEGQMGDNFGGCHARLLNAAFRKLIPAAHRSGTTLLFVNQVRHKSGVLFGSKETTTSGSALKYYASVRIDLRRVGPVKLGDQPIGQRVRVKVIKNKLGAPCRQAEIDLRWGSGIDQAGELLDLAKELGLVEGAKGGVWHFEDARLGVGKEGARAALLGSERLTWELRKAVLAAERLG